MQQFKSRRTAQHKFHRTPLTKLKAWCKSRPACCGLVLILIIFVVGFLTYQFQIKKPQQSLTPQKSSSSSTVEPENVLGQNEDPAAPSESSFTLSLSKEQTSDPNSQYVLVNKTHPLKNLSYRPTDLVIPNVATSSSDSNDERSVRKIMQADLEAMLSDAKSQGLSLTMNSGFRSYQAQEFYFNNYVAQSGMDSALQFSAKPGYSEHQTGLGIDINNSDRSCYLEDCFGSSAGGAWLAQNANKYGFILRYPKGKEAVTGYQYEPWHFRYVGRSLAAEFQNKPDLIYEEYLQSKGLLD